LFQAGTASAGQVVILEDMKQLFATILMLLRCIKLGQRTFAKFSGTYEGLVNALKACAAQGVASVDKGKLGKASCSCL